MSRTRLYQPLEYAQLTQISLTRPTGTVLCRDGSVVRVMNLFDVLTDDNFSLPTFSELGYKEINPGKSEVEGLNTKAEQLSQHSLFGDRSPYQDEKKQGRQRRQIRYEINSETDSVMEQKAYEEYMDNHAFDSVEERISIESQRRKSDKSLLPIFVFYLKNTPLFTSYNEENIGSGIWLRLVGLLNLPFSVPEFFLKLIAACFSTLTSELRIAYNNSSGVGAAALGFFCGIAWILNTVIATPLNFLGNVFSSCKGIIDGLGNVVLSVLEGDGKRAITSLVCIAKNIVSLAYAAAITALCIMFFPAISGFLLIMSGLSSSTVTGLAFASVATTIGAVGQLITSGIKSVLNRCWDMDMKPLIKDIKSFWKNLWGEDAKLINQTETNQQSVTSNKPGLKGMSVPSISQALKDARSQAPNQSVASFGVEVPVNQVCHRDSIHPASPGIVFRKNKRKLAVGYNQLSEDSRCRSRVQSCHR